MSGINAAFSELSAFTMRDQSRDITGSILGLNRFYDEIYKKSKASMKSSVDGGEYIARSVILLENPTTTNFDGYQPFNTDSAESATVVTVPWRNKAMVVTASGDDIRRNAGKAKIKDLVQIRVQVAKETQANHMAVELYGDGSASSSMFGLAYWLSTSGVGTPGGIDSTVYTNWKNQFLSVAASAGTAVADTYTALAPVIRQAMNSLYNKCEFGANEKPDMWLLSSDLYEAYQSAVIQQIRYTNDGDKEGSVESIRHLNAKVYRDTNANFGSTSETGYCLNTKHWELAEHPQAKWTDGGDRKPYNQDAVVRPFFWSGNLICKSRRTQGVLIA
jgi:hypothetical protein